MNTGKQINAMVIVLFVTLVVVGAYTIWDPFRSADAEVNQTDKSANFGAELFERNCRLCHGDRGEGGADGGRFAPAVALDRDDLQGIEDGILVQAAKDAAYKKVTDTIMCGRVGTQMPTWGEANGGTLNDEQIRQLAILITEGRWDLAEEHSDHTDAISTDHAEVEVEDGTFSADETDLTVSNAGPFTLGQYVRIGEERLRVLPKQILVERAVDGTVAAEHTLGTPILVDGEPVVRNQAPTLRGGQIVLLGGATESLAEAMTPEDLAISVGDNSGFEEGDIIQVDDERLRVTGTTTGLPSTGVVLAQEIRRVPEELFVSAPGDFADGELIRLGSEPMEIQGVAEAGTGVYLDDDTTADSVVVSVEEARFLRQDYQFRVGDEWIQVIDAISTGQVADETFGRAQTTFAISGTEGIEADMVIRLDDELMRITEVVRPARVQLARAQDDTAAAQHAAGTPLQIPAEEDAEDQTPRETGQATIEALDESRYLVALTSITRINVDDTYLLGGERVKVLAADPAIVRVERGVQDTEVAEHTRRSTIFVGNNLNVIRAINGSSAAAHSSDDEVILTQLEVERAVGVKPLEHAKQSEIFEGNGLTVARGVKDTEAEDHENGAVVRNFPAAPTDPPYTGTGRSVCGQSPFEPPSTTPGGPAPTPADGEQPVAVSLDEFSLEVDPSTGATGAFSFVVTNGGASSHNFRAIATDLAPDDLPMDGSSVNEDELDVVASTATISSGSSETVSIELSTGAYVLICNVPAHYEQGMHAAFTVG